MALLAAAMALSPAARAGTNAWTNVLGGSYFAVGSWVPAPVNVNTFRTNTALFHLPDAYTVTLDQGVTNDRLRFTNGVVTLDLGGRELVATNQAATALDAGILIWNSSLTVTNGLMRINNGNHGTLQPLHNSRLTFTGPNTTGGAYQLTTAWGSDNFGVSVRNGAQWFSYVNAIRGTGFIHVAGSGSRYVASNYIYMYSTYANTNHFIVSDGGTLTTPTLIFGMEAGPGRPVLVATDPGTVVTALTAYVGNNGMGFMTISNQAQAIFTSLYLQFSTATGSVMTVTGPGTLVDTRLLYISGDTTTPRPYSELKLEDGARLIATNIARIWPNGVLSLSNATLSLGAGAALDIRGTLRGAGWIDRITSTGTVAVTNLGLVQIGAPIGTLAIANGRYIQDVTAAMDMQLAGTGAGQYDRFAVGGDLDLGGLLNLSLTNGYAPAVGDTFNLLAWDGSMLGHFHGINTPDISPKRWVMRDLYTNGQVWVAGPELGVRTLPATNLLARSALLRGRILSAGGAENPALWFCVGTNDGGTNSLGAWDRVVAAGSDWAEDEDFSFLVTGLEPATMYYFRCYATNTSGRAWSANPVMSFRTTIPPSVTNLGATAVNRWIWTLQGEVTDTGGETPDLWFHYWSGTGPTSVVYAGSSTGAFSAQVSGLIEGATYSFLARASNAAGQAWSGLKTFATAGAGTTALYVRTTSTAPRTGASWLNAMTNLQDAINAAAPDTAIYVEGGVFQLTNEIRVAKSNLRIRGSYQGSGTPGSNNLELWKTRLTPHPAVVTNRVISIADATNVWVEDVEVAHGCFASANTVAAQYSGAGVLVSNSFGIMLAGCTIISNTTATTGTTQRLRGGGVCSVLSELTVSNCLVAWNSVDPRGNTATWTFGGGLAATGGVLSVVDSRFEANQVIPSTTGTKGVVQGAGLHLATVSAVVRNTALVGNGQKGWSVLAMPGDGIYVGSGTTRVESCTIYGNPDEGVYNATNTSVVSISNSILWANGDDVAGPGDTAVGYCNVQEGASGPGCFSMDPGFERGLFLASGSPCVDAGSGMAADFGLDIRTTRADGAPDTGVLDLGWHRRQGLDWSRAELYVSESGNDGYSGTNWNRAFRTVTKALQEAREGSRIHLAAGHYNVASGETFPLVMGQWGLQLLGTNRAATFLDASDTVGFTTRVLDVYQDHGDGGLQGLTIFGGSLPSGYKSNSINWL